MCLRLAHAHTQAAQAPIKNSDPELVEGTV